MYFKARIILIIGILSFCVLSCQNKGDFSSNNNSSPLDTVKNDIKLSLAEWSLHKALFDKEITHLEFISTAKKLGFEGVEYVNQFFKDKVNDVAYLDSMNSIASQNNIKQLLIMVDGEGYLADADSTLRNLAVENHIKWLQAAKHLGCASIRVNAHGEGTAQEVAQYAIDGLKKLSSRAQEFGINVIVENHGGFSSNGQWLSDVIEKVNLPNCGTLPDFGNFCIKREDGSMWNGPCIETYDKYQGINEMIPYAKAMSAKSYAFDSLGEETTIEYRKMIEIVKKHNYQGFIGVEFEGNDLDEVEGILKTKVLLEKYL